MHHIDVVIVGAGPAGIGMALELDKIYGLNYVVLESGRVGESFRRWPKQTKLITPSFYSNPFGLADLNSVDAYSSPALTSGVEHLSGAQYADYLVKISEQANLPIASGCKVLGVTPEDDFGFHIETEHGELFAEFLIWACGEFQFPDRKPFSGGHWCHHYADIKTWERFQDGDYTVIGGYESGLDAAVNLIAQGCRVRLLIRHKTWDLPDETDPSRVLSPYTRQRFREVEKSELLEIIYNVHVESVQKSDWDGYEVVSSDGRLWHTEAPPILGTGFVQGGGATQIRNLWQWDNSGKIVLNSSDESEITPGLFLVGPHVRHPNAIFCFIYKFRQRFERIARELAVRASLGYVSPNKTSMESWGPLGNSECCEDCEC